ncbi:MAG: beta-ketoacyl synthase N-terminal-like domain-containing protein [Dysgonomonas sp.]|nr:beta-ketoacyl synthase N-terminal-like domain-containing protein [Dysgonomonas sp.]
MGNNLNIYLASDNIISSLGFSTKENLEAIYSLHSGILSDNSSDISDTPILSARIDTKRLDTAIQKYGIEQYNKTEQLAILSIKELLSNQNIDITSSDCGLIISTTKGNVDLLRNHTDEINKDAYLWKTASNISSHFGIDKNNIKVISNACISGVSALIVAQRLLRKGVYKHIIVVGVDALSHFITSGFLSFKSVSEHICKPYDAERDGLSLGEACGSILLTTEHTPDAVTLRGGAISNDANHISGPSRTGDGLHFAIEGAMNDADIAVDDIDFVNLHGTATVYNDEMESKAIYSSNLQSKPINSLKSYFGHTLGASGIIETIVSAHSLKEKIVFGIPTFEKNGTSQPLNISNSHRNIPDIKTCIKTASGFGGCNAAIVLSLNPSEKDKTADDITIEHKSCSIGNNTIKINDDVVFSSNAEDFATFIREAYKNLEESNQKFYKMDNLSKLGYIAASYLLKNTDINTTKTGIILANSASSLDTDTKFQRIIDENGDEGASPSVFVYTLANIVAGEICIRHKIQGDNTFFISQEEDLLFLQDYTKLALENTDMQHCIYGWCEFLNNKYKAEFRLIDKI